MKHWSRFQFQVKHRVQSRGRRYAQGHLFYQRENSVFVRAFDAKTFALSQDATPIAGTGQQAGRMFFSASNMGVAAYKTPARGITTELAWFDRTGKRLGIAGKSGSYFTISLSPKNDFIAMQVGGDIQVYDILRGTLSKLTHPGVNEFGPIWSPDGSRIAFENVWEVDAEVWYTMLRGAMNNRAKERRARTKICCPICAVNFAFGCSPLVPRTSVSPSGKAKCGCGLFSFYG